VLSAFAIVTLILTLGTAGLFVLSFSAQRPSSLGVRDGRLASCPDSPNCVSTQAEDREHWIAPITFEQDPDSVIDTLEKLVTQLPRTRVIEKSSNYLYVEFRSSFFRFVDDVEFSVERESRRIHFRSASRVGHSDLGVNRKRMELIRILFQKSQSTPMLQHRKSPGPGQNAILARGRL
jgi:uncharacterized protein (DUF1499 family)